MLSIVDPHLFVFEFVGEFLVASIPVLCYPVDVLKVGLLLMTVLQFLRSSSITNSNSL